MKAKKIVRYTCGAGNGMFEDKKGHYISYVDYEKSQQEKIKEFYMFLIEREIIENPFDEESFDEYLYDDFMNPDNKM